MHANRNKKAVKRVEKGMMKANRIRNLFAVFAIVLTTFMITTVFSLGMMIMIILFQKVLADARTFKLCRISSLSAKRVWND